MEYEINDLLKYAKKLGSYNLDKLSSGNISLRLSNGFIAIKPTGYTYDELTIDNISIIDLDGNHIKGDKPSSDLMIHIEIYKKRDDINCIIHTHSHYATVMSCLNKPLKVLTTLQADYFGKDIYCMPYMNHRTSNIGIEALKSGEDIMLLERHGTLMFQDNIIKLIKKAVILEEIAKLNYNILQINKEYNSLNEKDINKLNDYYSNKYGN